MVKLRWLYATLLAVTVVTFVVPATRRAMLGSPLIRGFQIDESLFLGLGGAEPRRDPTTVAEAIGEAWALAAAAELAPLGSAEQRRLLDRALECSPRSSQIMSRRAALLVGHAFGQPDGDDPQRVAEAVQAVRELSSSDGYTWLLRATVAVHQQRWDEAARALRAVPRGGMRLPYEDLAPSVSELLHRAGLPRLEASATGTLLLMLPELAALRQAGDRIVERAVALRAAGREREAAELLLASARAGESLRRGRTTLIAAMVGIAIEFEAFGAGQPDPEPPAAVREAREGPQWTAEQRAERFAARLDALGLADDAAWVRAEPAVAERVKQAAREVTSGYPGLGPANPPARAMVFWGLLAIWLIGAGLFSMFLCPVPLSRSQWLPWRPVELAAVLGTALLVALPFAVIAAARFLPAAIDGPPEATQRVIGLMVLAIVILPLLLAAACWGLGWRFARRTEPGRGWPRLRAAGHFARRAIAVPALAATAMLLTLALLCAVPIAVERGEAARAVGAVCAFERQVVAAAVADLPFDPDGDRRR